METYTTWIYVSSLQIDLQLNVIPIKITVGFVKNGHWHGYSKIYMYAENSQNNF